MATLEQYWTDEVARIGNALDARQAELAALRTKVLQAEAALRTTADAVRSAGASVVAARRALAAIAMPADGDPLLAAMEAAIVTLRNTQAELASGELGLQGLRAELVLAEQDATALAAELAAARQALTQERAQHAARVAMVDKLSTGDLANLGADATAALASSEAGARARVEHEFPSSGTASKHFLKRVRERKRIVGAILASHAAVADSAWRAGNPALASAQGDFDLAVAAVRTLAEAAPLLASDSATLERLAALPAPNPPHSYPILTRWQHEHLHDATKKVQRETALAKLTAVDAARTAVIAKQESYDSALHAAMQAEPDQTQAQLDATTLATAKGELDAKLADLEAARTAYLAVDAADRAALDAWFAAVPDVLWDALDNLDSALARLEILKGPPTAATLIGAMDAAEAALASALDAARVAERERAGARRALQRASARHDAERETAVQRAAAISRSSALF